MGDRRMSEERIYIPEDMRERDYWGKIAMMIGASLVGAGVVFVYGLMFY
jgi:hypothetical protein